jgi:hypothetical protein
MTKITKELKVFGIPWHTAHQHELAKIFGQYDLLINPYRGWATQHRPLPENTNLVTHYKPGYYDFALLHVDQQSIYDPEVGDRISKGRIYEEINELIQDIPKVVINHMTPFHDKYETNIVVQKINALIGDNTMVVNSYTAKEQWGWGNVITHGMDADEWWDLPKEPRAITTLSPAGMNKAYRREFLFAVQRILKEMGVPFVWVGSDVKFDDFDSYREFIGRSLVYFNPTWQSPRPRARTEAMLSGACCVTTPYQDADSYIEDGVNGFLTSKVKPTDPRVMDSPEYTAKLIKRLVMDDPHEALKVGQAGKQTCKELFNLERFQEQWQNLLNKIL